MSSVAERRRRIRWSLLAPTIVCLVGTARAQRDEVREVRLAVTASVAGEVTTCGCASGPQGGLARRSARFDLWRSETPDLLILDAGGYASTDTIVGELVTDSLRVYMAREGYAAVAVGDEEIAAGLLDRATEGAPLAPPHVSANLLRERNGKLLPATERFVVAEPGGIRVGITAVVSPELVGRVATRPADLLVTDPSDAARDVLAEMRGEGCEVAVLLAHMPDADAEALAREVTGYDVVVVGHWPRARVTHAVDAGCVLVRPGDRGRYVADVALYMDAHGLARVAGHTEGIERRDSIDTDVGRWVQRTLDDVAAARRRAMLTASGTRSEGRRYSGAAACAVCHQAEYVSWAATPHARALETLEAAGMDHANECVACHVTGFGEVSRAGGAGGIDLSGVQCEACHAVPEGHPQAPEVPRVEPISCRRCHDAENSPDYDPDGYWRRVLHTPR